MLIPLLGLTLVLVACQPIENSARDAAATLGGVLVKAQEQHLGSCVSNPAQDVCKLINRGIAAQNALITAAEAYCGWSQAAAPDLSAKCVPVKGAQAALATAIANANTIIPEIKGVVH